MSAMDELDKRRAEAATRTVVAEALTYEHFDVPDALQLMWREGYAPEDAPDLPAIPLEQIDAMALSQLCNHFRAVVFRKARKDDPHPPSAFRGDRRP